MFQRPSCFRYVIKELVHAFSCAYIELWMQLGSLESTQEARVALTLLSCHPNFPRASVTRYTHAKHEPILKFRHAQYISVTMHVIRSSFKAFRET